MKHNDVALLAGNPAPSVKRFPVPAMEVECAADVPYIIDRNSMTNVSRRTTTLPGDGVAKAHLPSRSTMPPVNKLAAATPPAPHPR